MRRTRYWRSTSAAIGSGATKAASPSCAKAFSSALSSNSATICGRSPCASNQCSRARRSEVFSVGRIIGAPASERGKPRASRRASRGGAKTATAHSPSRCEYARTPALGGTGASESTTSSSCSASAASRRSGLSSRQTSRIGSGRCCAGASSERAISFGTASAMPTSSRSGRPLGRPRSVSWSSVPSAKISSA
jgi:hypothetical protein